MSNASILIVDDEQGIRSTIHDILTDEGYAVETAADAREARSHYSAGQPDLVLLDIWMPDTDGITLLKEWADSNVPLCPVIVMSGHGTVETAVEATRLGAVDYIEKPVSLEQLLATIEGALEQKNAPAATQVQRRRQASVEIPPGKSAVIRAVREQAQQIAAQTLPVLITGEPGSGRDLFGQYIHSLSDKADGPFVLVSGATMTDDNVVDQLLGGGPQNAAPGLLEQAAGGTLFVSELQGLGPRAQSLLLGIVEQGTYTLPGHSQPEPVKARIMASVQRTSGDGLRADLLAALGVLQLSVPALREYVEDIPELLRYYVHSVTSSE
ncbi:MAG: response regulator, partial [Gammaproteobacteria bacterium]|nr:response regulator [Gammaproteobacteria bacterium]